MNTLPTPLLNGIMEGMDVVNRIAEATRGTPWQNRLFLVGGAVRDVLLGLPPPKDVDIVLEGDALKLARFLYEKGLSRIPPTLYPRFGTALLMMDDSKVELATTRKESYVSQSRKPQVQRASLYEDALRRDFTVNTLLKNIHTGELLDLLGTGLADLQARLLRTPMDPRQTFSDDPLRMLRAIRFKNRFGFQPVPELWEAIREEKDRLSIVSAERIRDELVLMLLHESAGQSLQDLMDRSLFSVFAPEFCEGVGVEQGSYHTRDVWEHTVDVVERAVNLKNIEGEERLLVVLSALFHDVAKPRTKTVDAQGRVRFFGHDKQGAEIARTRLLQLRFSRAVADKVAKLVANHMRLGSAVPFTMTAARRLVRDMGDLTDLLITLVECDARAIGRREKELDFEDIRRKLQEVMEQAQKVPLSSPLSGEEIMELLEVPPGEKVGYWKKRLTEAVLEGEIPPGDKETARKWLLQHARPERSEP